jgi:hypothetical protein
LMDVPAIMFEPILVSLDDDSFENFDITSKFSILTSKFLF